VLDRFIQQAVLQVLQPEWDKTFSETSYGFRPGRSTHQAVAKAESYIKAGYSWVVDIDLEKFFDQVNHNRLLAALRKRINDERVVKLIHRFLKAGVMENGVVSATDEGTPQGGPLSPLLSNLVLDELDKELERRNHLFVRYADDCNIYVKSQRAGERVMENLSKFITGKLKLKINQEKSAVARPWKRKILGFSFNARSKKRTVALKSIERLKAKIRKVTSRTGGKSLGQVVAVLSRYLIGWREYFSFAHHRTVFREIDSWIKRKLRCMLYKQWGSRRYRELRARGVSVRVAWVTYKAPHGPWRLSHCPALQTALPNSFFRDIGLPSLARSY
jgi:RNA-directed DNA polymerase